MNETSFSNGILNKGNTCYISSALQILFRFNPFIQVINRISGKISENNIFSVLSKQQNEFETSGKPLNPTPLLNFMNIDPNAQNDIIEFLTKLLDMMFDFKGIKEIDNLKNMFYLNSERTERKFKDTQIFLAIPVTINQSIEECVKLNLENNNETIERSPDLLFVQIQRMHNNHENNEIFKDSSPMIISDKITINNEIYLIYCIVQHIGGSKSGHYVSLIHDSNGWLKCNDSLVTPISEEEVFTSSFDTHTPAYLLAYVHDFSNIKTIRTESQYRLNLVFFDAKEMKEVESFESCSNSYYDSELLINEIKSNWESLYRCKLQTHFQFGNGIITKELPDIKTDILVWFEREEMRSFNPNAARIEAIPVILGICNTSFKISINFHPEQTPVSIYHFGKRLMNDYFHNSTSRIRLFFEIEGKLIRIRKNIMTTLFEFQCFYQAINFSISIDNPEPKNLLKANISIYQTEDILIEKEPLSININFEDNIDSLLKKAKLNLEVNSCTLYSIKEPYKMKIINGNRKLYEIVLSEQKLRIEKTPDSNAITFIIQSYNFCFKFVIKDDETIEELEERVSYYLHLAYEHKSLKIFFKLDGNDNLIKPKIPSREINIFSDSVIPIVVLKTD